MPISHSAWNRINDVLRNAAADGRRILYEFEVYQILAELGLQAPRFAFVRDPREVDTALLGRIGGKLVIKVVSPQIAHKQRAGGVKFVDRADPIFVQFVMSRLREEVLSRWSPDQTPDLRGFLVCEFIPHTQALGYEILIGFKADPAFGPVVTITKGGEDAEFFARYFDPANLFIPPLEPEYALKMLRTLKIRHKFEQIGHPEYLEFMARATERLSALAERYSIIAPEPPEFYIQAFEVNPFVITKDNRLVAIDGFAQFAPATEGSVPALRLENLDSLFAPRGVAVIGVSADPAKYCLGREIARLLHDLKRTDLYLVNPKGGSLAFEDRTYPLYPRLRDIPAPVELAVYAAPASGTIPFVRDLVGTAVKAVILISGIPANIAYADFAGQLSAAMPPGVRVIGPNCMGVFTAPEEGQPGLNTLFIEEKRLEVKSSPHSNTVLLTQSGAFAVTAIDKLHEARLFKTIVSIGNKCDVKIADLLAYFEADPGVDVIALYIEGLDPGEGRQFFDLARRSPKPILVYKSGRTEAGARAAASHTASMTGSYDVFKAACQQAGAIVAENIEDLYDYIKAFALLSRKPPCGNRVAGVVNAGFESTVGADELKNLRQAQLSPATLAELNRINEYGLVDTSSPFLDITPMADDRMYAEFVEAILADENVDCVFVAIVPHAVALKTIPETCRDADGLAQRLVALSHKHAKPMVVSVNAGHHYEDFVSILEEHGLPVYTDIRAAIKSLDTFVTRSVKE